VVSLKTMAMHHWNEIRYPAWKICRWPIV